MQELAGKAALVTGASRGIGAAAARALAAAGAGVVLAARSLGQSEAVAAEIRAAGGHAEAVACDVADYAQVAAAVARAQAAFGRLDILVNNAGLIDPIARLADSDPAGWGQVVDVNLKGVYHGLRAAIPAMEAAGGGVIVNISSGAAVSALEGWSHYCATKAAVLSLTRCAQKEYGPLGIRTVGLSPGTVATGMQRQIRASGINPVSQIDWEAHIPADWAGRAVAWLCTADAAEFAGEDVSLREPDIRKRVGLI
ncbi:SDR family oxidoreductase [Paralimibaculum aggregatum]|uniref:SDR family oxidoreductase n=1 Tax=Paralimibaculum aggregatum TaxID=3036245 RepID=A0ABQ6LIH5_9RHOB|nr:SDR family NAD(P)-dependent oxidoreductase [Limibaculum sp. NKW23]GMG83088.1 SDR family oxidoreductase [Limibaculum sp. NKW23]